MPRGFARGMVPELLLKGWKEVASRSAIATESLLMNFSLYRMEFHALYVALKLELWKIRQDLYTYYPIYFWKILGYISVCPSIYFEQEKTLKFARKNFTFSSEEPFSRCSCRTWLLWFDWTKWTNKSAEKKKSHQSRQKRNSRSFQNIG